MTKAKIGDVVYLMSGITSTLKTIRLYEIISDSEAYGKSITDNTTWKVFSFNPNGLKGVFWSANYQRMEDEVPNVKKVTIEVEIPSGYEFVRYDIPKNGDQYIIGNNTVVTADNSVGMDKKIIVKKLWVKPDFLKTGWIAKDKIGLWFWYSEKPIISQTIWKGNNSINLKHFNWTPPEVDWENSLIQV